MNRIDRIEEFGRKVEDIVAAVVPIFMVLFGVAALSLVIGMAVVTWRFALS